MLSNSSGETEYATSTIRLPDMCLCCSSKPATSMHWVVTGIGYQSMTRSKWPFCERCDAHAGWTAFKNAFPSSGEVALVVAGVAAGFFIGKAIANAAGLGNAAGHTTNGGGIAVAVVSAIVGGFLPWLFKKLGDLKNSEHSGCKSPSIVITPGAVRGTQRFLFSNKKFEEAFHAANTTAARP